MRNAFSTTKTVISRFTLREIPAPLSSRPLRLFRFPNFPAVISGCAGKSTFQYIFQYNSSLSFSLLLSGCSFLFVFSLPAKFLDRYRLSHVSTRPRAWNLVRLRGEVKIKTFCVRFEREWLPFFFFFQQISFSFIGDLRIYEF